VAARDAGRARRFAEEHGVERVEERYEALVESPHAEADRVAEALGTEPGPLRTAFARVHGESLGRWRRELTASQLADVEAEAGDLLRELGYA